MIKTRVIKLQVPRSERAWSQIALDQFHSFLVEVHTKLATHARSMRNSHPEIRIAGPSCRTQLTDLKNSSQIKNKQMISFSATTSKKYLLGAADT